MEFKLSLSQIVALQIAVLSQDSATPDTVNNTLSKFLRDLFDLCLESDSLKLNVSIKSDTLAESEGR